jgi:hypothetical protein
MIVWSSLICFLPMPVTIGDYIYGVNPSKYMITSIDRGGIGDNIYFNNGSQQMTIEAQKTKILASIQSRGWMTTEIFWKAAKELEAAGQIKMGDKYFTGGNLKPVWVAP